MYQAAEKIYRELIEKGDLKVFVEDEENTHVWLQFSLENGAPYRIRFISTDNDNDVALRVFSLVSVDEGKRDKVLQVLNDLNCQFRYAKFTCKEDGDVNVEYDYPVACSNPAESAKEMVIRFVNIINHAYPQIMRAIWA